MAVVAVAAAASLAALPGEEGTKTRHTHGVRDLCVRACVCVRRVQEGVSLQAELEMGMQPNQVVRGTSRSPLTRWRIPAGQKRTPSSLRPLSLVPCPRVWSDGS